MRSKTCRRSFRPTDHSGADLCCWPDPVVYRTRVHEWLSRVPHVQGRRASPVGMVHVDVEELDGSPAVDARLGHASRSTRYQRCSARNVLLLDAAGHSGPQGTPARHKDRREELARLECSPIGFRRCGDAGAGAPHHDCQRHQEIPDRTRGAGVAGQMYGQRDSCASRCPSRVRAVRPAKPSGSRSS